MGRNSKSINRRNSKINSAEFSYRSGRNNYDYYIHNNMNKALVPAMLQELDDIIDFQLDLLDSKTDLLFDNLISEYQDDMIKVLNLLIDIDSLEEKLVNSEVSNGCLFLLHEVVFKDSDVLNSEDLDLFYVSELLIRYIISYTLSKLFEEVNLNLKPRIQESMSNLHCVVSRSVRSNVNNTSRLSSSIKMVFNSFLTELSGITTSLCHTYFNDNVTRFDDLFSTAVNLLVINGYENAKLNNESISSEELFEDFCIDGSVSYSYIAGYRELNSIANSKGFNLIRCNGDHGIFRNSLGSTVVIPQGRDVGKGLSIKIQKSLDDSGGFISGNLQ